MSCRHVYLLRSDNCKVPSFYLQCDTTSLSPLRVRFIARIVDQQDAERSVTKGEYSKLLETLSNTSRG